jgi:hypothetical protein
MAQPADSVLKPAPDRAIIRLVRALARDAAREDHERDMAGRQQTRSDLQEKQP